MTTGKNMDLDKKYLVCPGYVKSINDGELHYISAYKLMRLYNVHPRECIINNYNKFWSKLDSMSDLDKGHLIKLAPRRDGNYNRFKILTSTGLPQET